MSNLNSDAARIAASLAGMTPANAARTLAQAQIAVLSGAIDDEMLARRRTRARRRGRKFLFEMRPEVAEAALELAHGDGYLTITDIAAELRKRFGDVEGLSTSATGRWLAKVSS
ncbi:hypothetical protein [Thiocapsa rosea]|uniref:Uncharacterized protein n=1 Tax=Thiocapsa rosea TaxID=69360 RepID=A0A495V532_9GAMM|nr:hypothetical protein [Thiocapsa rosea]RKT44512.1 hypothetical protein BDD21_1897 [Thiocapsa rosea]